MEYLEIFFVIDQNALDIQRIELINCVTNFIIFHTSPPDQLLSIRLQFALSTTSQQPAYINYSK